MYSRNTSRLALISSGLLIKPFNSVCFLQVELTVSCLLLVTCVAECVVAFTACACAVRKVTCCNNCCQTQLWYVQIEWRHFNRVLILSWNICYHIFQRRTRAASSRNILVQLSQVRTFYCTDATVNYGTDGVRHSARCTGNSSGDDTAISASSIR